MRPSARALSPGAFPRAPTRQYRFSCTALVKYTFPRRNSRACASRKCKTSVSRGHEAKQKGEDMHLQACSARSAEPRSQPSSRAASAVLRPSHLNIFSFRTGFLDTFFPILPSHCVTQICRQPLAAAGKALLPASLTSNLLRCCFLLAPQLQPYEYSTTGKKPNLRHPLKCLPRATSPLPRH